MATSGLGFASPVAGHHAPIAERLTSRARLLGRVARAIPTIARARPDAHFTAGDLIERGAAKWPDRCCIRQNDRTLTYREVNEQANRVAHWATSQDFGQGTTVGLLMENRPEFVTTWLGLAKIGAATALLNTKLRGDALAHSLRAAGCDRLIVGVECRDGYASIAADPELPQPVWLADPDDPSATPPGNAELLDPALREQTTTDPPAERRATLRGSDPLFFIFTSGTTGLPKAARLSHSRFLGGGLYATLAGLRGGDVMYCALPLYHTVGGVMCVNAVLTNGASLALAREFRAGSFWDDIDRYGATAFQYVGELCRYLVNQPPHALERRHSLRFALGNGLRPDVWVEFQRRFGVPRMVEFYGATESNVTMVNLIGPVGSIGRPPPGMKVALVRYDVDRGEVVRDRSGRCIRCDVDEPGEMLGQISQGRSGAGRFEGYASREESERKILRDVFEAGDAWFRTGDLLAIDSDGYYRFVDRVGDTFRWKGENVSTQEVAEIVGGAANVELCAVYGVHVPGSEGRAGMASIVMPPDAVFDPDDMYQLVEQALPAYARPAFLRRQDAADLTGTMKLRKVDLQRQGFDPSAIDDQLWYRDDPSRTYAELDSTAYRRILDGGLRL